MISDFDRLIDRAGTSSTKWERYAGRDMLPFWVADMDFAMPAFIRGAIARRLEHPIIGYTRTPAPVVQAFQDWLARHYGWNVPRSGWCGCPAWSPASISRRARRPVPTGRS
jgi:cysteine-S-conjugate beta-lyase